MKALCVTPCGSKKIWDTNPGAGPTPAKDVYVGPFARKCQEYARRFHPFSWCILSAKFGFLFPDDIVPENYNVSFNDKKSNPIGFQELISQAKAKDLNKYERVVVLGGRKYVAMIKNTFPGKHVVTPLSDCKGIGFMMGKLNDALKKATPLSSV
jgi:hypothetical protein